MPPRLDLTPEQALARIERERERSRLRSARYRARHRDAVTVIDRVTVTPNGFGAHPHAGTDVRGYGALVTSSPTEKSENETTTDFEQVRCVLEPLRGYAHDERLLQRLAATCPAVDLVLEAIGMAEWLTRAANRKRTCSKAFLSNWVKRAAAAPVGRSDPHPAAHEPRSALGRVLEQIATSPVDGPSTWGNR